MLVKSTIKIDDSKVDKDELYTYLKQRPNRKILGLWRFHLGVYNAANRGKDRKFKEWVRKTIGEEPALFDAALTEKSRKQLSIYMANKGYFNAVVTDSIHLQLKRNGTPKKKASITYNVTSNAPYRIRKIAFSIGDTALTKPVLGSAKRTLLQPGNNYDTDILSDERLRITREMKNRGYQQFAKEYVFFSVDSTINKNRVNITVGVKNPMERVPTGPKTDTLIERLHELYYVNEIFMNTRYDPSDPTAGFGDTLVAGHLNLFQGKELLLRPEVLVNAVSIQPEELYNLADVEFTQNRLAGLGTFKFINIEFQQLGKVNGRNLVDCYINLTPSPKKSIALETQGTNRGGNLGISGYLSYKNKNTFRGAEILELRLGGGLEAQSSQVTQQSGTLNNLPFNTLEVGPELRLYFPKLLLPKKLQTPLKAYSPNTTLAASFNFQQRPDFERSIASLSYGYKWRNDAYSSFGFDLADISYVNITTDEAFQTILDDSNNSLLQNSYNDHFVVASRFTYTFNNQNINKFNNPRYLKTTIEGAGNAVQLLSNVTGREHNSEGHYDIFEVQYAQYVKSEVDYRYYNRLNKWSNMVYRSYVGAGVPLTNLEVLPFEKSFFSGGANGMRAWRARTLGPGGLTDTSLTSIDHIGDIKLEGNLEYRFDIAKILEGAAFVDAGNVWLLREDTQRPQGEWQWERFYKELAVGVGLGARFDFSFFIIRLDAGLQFKDPRLPEGERWLWEPKTTYNKLKVDIDPSYDGYSPRVTFNLGIGYPF